MSLKHDIEEYPEFWSKELVAALKDYKNGEWNSKRKLRKFVNREISEHYYNELIERHGFSYRINKERQDRKRSKKIKKTLWGIGAFWILLESFLLTWGYVINRYEKTGGFWYLFLYIFAICFILDYNSEEVSKLKYENERLKEELEHYKSNERDVAHGNQEEKENETP